VRGLAAVLAVVLGVVTIVAVGQVRDELAESCPIGWDTATRVDAARKIVPPERREVESPLQEVELIGSSYQFDGSLEMHMHWAEAPRNPFQRPELGLSVTTFARDAVALAQLEARCIRATGVRGSWSRRAHGSDVLTQPLAGRVYRFDGACCGPEWPLDSMARLELLVVARGDLYRIDLGEMPVIGAD
jgi:hypothetical protein